MLGLPFAFASHFAPRYLFDALKIYKDNFKPSVHLSEPYAMACVNVIASETDERADHLATSFQMLALGLIRNKRKPLQPPIETMEGIWNDAEQDAVKQMMKYSFIGSEETVHNSLQSFLATTGVDEIMVTTHVYEPNARLRSYEIISKFFKLR
jgi:luciferase family oxidoreductase group 1